MEDFATATGDVIYGLGIMAKIIKELTTIPGVGSLFDIKNIPVIGAYLGGLQQIGQNAREKNNPFGPNVGGYSGIPDIRTTQALTKARKEEFKIITKKNAIENKNVEELKKKFDLERIGLTAALSKATDEETKLRLKAQLAILDNNDALAKKILAEMEAAEALKKLAEQAKVAGLSITEFALVQVKSLIARINAQIEKINAEFGMPTTSTSAASAGTALPASYFQELAVSLVGTTGYSGMNVAQIATERARESGNRSVDVNLTVSSPSGDRFAQLMAESIQVAGRSGYSTAPNGGLP
jgi:hypothetical protein